MEYDLSVFISASAAGIPLVFVVIGLVWWYGKAFGLVGRAQFISSMVTGLVLGMLYQVFATEPPSSILGWWAVFGYWFVVVLYGLGLGVLASALYDVAKDLVVKLVQKLIPHIPQ